MKKNILALAVALGTISTIANAAPEPGSIYIGGKVGYSQFYNTDTEKLESDGFSVSNVKKNNFASAAFIGIQADTNLAFEFGFDWLGNVKYELENGGEIKETVWGGQISAKLNFPFPSVDDLDFYVSAGVFLANAKIDLPDNSGNHFSVAPMGTIGLSYALNDDLSTQFEYQYIGSIDSGYDGFKNANNGLFGIGLTYNLGKVFDAKLSQPEYPKAVTTESVSNVETKTTVDTPKTKVETITHAQETPIINTAVSNKTVQLQNQEWTLSADVLFGFGSSTLTDEGEYEITSLLDSLIAKSSTANLTSISNFIVTGYSDRLGSEAYNLQLSQKRAEAVKKFIMSQGVKSSEITAVGKGINNPVTEDACDNISVREALISCLSPDRRVVISLDIEYMSENNSLAKNN